MEKIIKDGIHFIGIGGIGMSAIAEVLIQNGFKISGSDVASSKMTDRLKSLGARIFIGHNSENINDASIVVYSSAIKSDNPEYSEAKARSIPLLKRADVLAALIKEKKSIAIAGAHGKSTTSSMLATIFCELGVDPTYIIGGIVNNLKKNANAGKGEWLIAEADESDGTFLLYSPLYASISNIDIEHLDHYKTKENIIDAFIKFANSVPFYGYVFLNKDDALTMEHIADKVERKKIYISTMDSNADYYAANVTFRDRTTSYELYKEGKFIAKVNLKIMGRHNVYNSLHALAISEKSGLNLQQVINSVGNFQGVERRMQTIYKSETTEFIEDYAHHPTEINAVCQALKPLLEGHDLKILFEPHRFTRFSDLWNEFASCFSNIKGKLYVLPVYSAGEAEIENVSSTRFVKELNQIKGSSSFASYIEYEDLKDLFRPILGQRCKVLILGAGKVGKLAKQVLSELDGKNTGS